MQTTLSTVAAASTPEVGLANTSTRQAAKRLLQPIGAYGLNTSIPGCIVPIDEDHIIHASGDLLILQNLEESGRFRVLPEHEKTRTLFGLAVCDTAQILAVCGQAWDGSINLCLYYTANLRVTEDVASQFRRARSFQLPSGEARPRTAGLAGTGPGGGGGLVSASPVVNKGRPPIVMDFSPNGKVLIAVVDSTVHMIEWQRSKFLFHYAYPGGRIHTLRFHPEDPTCVTFSGQGFLKLWRVKTTTMAPQPDIQGLQLTGQHVVDHMWLHDRSGIVAVTRQGKFICIDPVHSKQQYIENVLGGDEPGGIAPLTNTAFVVVGGRGRAVILKEIDQSKAKRRESGVEKFGVVRLISAAELNQDILGVHMMASHRVVYWTQGYIGTTHRDKLLRKGLDDELPVLDVMVCKEFHTAPVLGLAVCVRKPLLATYSAEPRDCSVRIWHYRLHKCLMHHKLGVVSPPTGLAFHPSGHQIIVSFEEAIRVYHVMEKELRAVFEIPLKGMVRIPSTKILVPTSRVSFLSFNHGGSLLAIVTGKVIQLYCFYSALDGLPAREHVLVGHNTDVTQVVWGLDDLRLFSVSSDVVLEWRVGQETRVREVFPRGGRFTGLALSYDGTLVSCRTADDNFADCAAGTSWLCVWPGNTDAAAGAGGGDEQVHRNIPVPETVTCIVATTNASDESSTGMVQNLIIAGTANGDHYILDLNVLANQSEDDASIDESVLLNRTFHGDKITAAMLTLDNTQLFSAAGDGTLYVCDVRACRNTSRFRASRSAMDSIESLLPEEAVTLAERSMLAGVEAHILQLQADLLEQQSINNYQVEAAAQEREKMLAGLTVEQRAAVDVRDARITDLQELVERLREEKDTELRQREAAYAKGSADLEVMYQRKLTLSALQYTKLKEAFNDLVVAAKEDTAAVKKEGQTKEQQLTEVFEKERKTLLKEQEMLRGYVDYLKVQYDSLLEDEDKIHDDQVIKLKADIEVEHQRLASAGTHNKFEMHMLTKEIGMLQQVVNEKDDSYRELQIKYDQEARKTQLLERRLKESEKEIVNQAKVIEKWESKAGEQEEHLVELQKTRNVLLCQLRELRDSIPKKDKDLVEMKARLQEIDLEYGKGLQSRADLEKRITEQARRLKSMHQELVSLRRAYQKKESVLDKATEQISDLVSGQVDSVEALDGWRERLREYLPCLQKNARETNDSIQSLKPLTPLDLTVGEQSRQNVFLRKDINRLVKKLASSDGKQGKLIKVRTSQNNFLMNEMNKLRRVNRKLEMKLRETTAKLETERHRSRANQSAEPQMNSFTELDRIPEEEEQFRATVSAPVEKTAKLLTMPAVGSEPLQHPKTAAAVLSRQRLKVCMSASLTEGYRQLEKERETARANEAESRLDVALSDNARLGSQVEALSMFLKSMGIVVDEMLGDT